MTSADPAVETVGEPAEEAEVASSDDTEADGFDIDDPDDMRIDADVGEEMFGARYVTYGPTQFGANNTMNNYFTKQILDPIMSALNDIAGIVETYARTTTDAALDELLEWNWTACLSGPTNSGRFTSACAALARKHGRERLHEILLPVDTPVGALVKQRKQILTGHGYLLRWPRKDYVETMRSLADLFHERSATLLLVVNREGREREPHSAEVRHRQPDPVEVFARHLKQRLRLVHHLPADRGDHLVKRYLSDGNLRSELQRTYGPREAAHVARLIGERSQPLAADDMACVLDETQPRRRRRAARILLPQERVPAARRRDRQHERAFRIAYAVFGRQPVHYVFESASWLLAEIDSAALRPDWGSLALEHSVCELLGPDLEGDWAEGQDVTASSAGSSRSAWIRDTSMRGAILDVAWHEFDNTREPLLRWLNRLVRDGDLTMNRAAAYTAALLAHHDFDQIHSKLIDDWAGSRRPRLRQAAAWAETVAPLGGQVGDRILRRIRAWSTGGSNYQRDTAARVYASGLQQPVLAWSMADLRRIAADRMQRRWHAVARGVNQLYAADRAGWIITELAFWAEDPLVRVHAARALVMLASRVVDTGGNRPELLDRVVAGDVDITDLARVWQAAFLVPEVTGSAWPVFVRWLNRADTDDVLRASVASLLQQTMRSERERRRALFYLDREWNYDDEVPRWIRTLLIGS